MGRIRVGVIGCGLIGQMMHLPHLKELHELFEVVALCDVSPGTLRYVGDYYGVAKRFTGHHQLLKESMDAAVVLSADSHGQVIVDALRAGKHVFTEKPMCFTLREADEILAAHKKAGTVCMVTYMKRYDPGFGYAQPLIQQMKDLQASFSQRSYGNGKPAFFRARISPGTQSCRASLSTRLRAMPRTLNEDGNDAANSSTW